MKNWIPPPTDREVTNTERLHLECGGLVLMFAATASYWCGCCGKEYSDIDMRRKADGYSAKIT